MRRIRSDINYLLFYMELFTFLVFLILEYCHILLYCCIHRKNVNVAAIIIQLYMHHY